MKLFINNGEIVLACLELKFNLAANHLSIVIMGCIQLHTACYILQEETIGFLKDRSYYQKYRSMIINGKKIIFRAASVGLNTSSTVMLI